MDIKKALILSLFIHSALFGLSKYHAVFKGEKHEKQGFITISLNSQKIDQAITDEKDNIEEIKSDTADFADKGMPETSNTNYFEEGGSETIETYFSMVRSKIIKNLNYPRSSRINNEEGVVEICFSLDKNGVLVNLEILQNSIFDALNKNAVQTLSRAAPFDPFPESISQPTLTFKLPLKYELKN